MSAVILAYYVPKVIAYALPGPKVQATFEKVPINFTNPNCGLYQLTFNSDEKLDELHFDIQVPEYIVQYEISRVPTVYGKSLTVSLPPQTTSQDEDACANLRRASGEKDDALTEAIGSHSVQLDRENVPPHYALGAEIMVNAAEPNDKPAVFGGKGTYAYTRFGTSVQRDIPLAIPPLP